MMRKAVHKRTAILLANLVLAAGVGFSAPTADVLEPLPIRIGYQPNPDWLLFVAREERLFEQAGLAPTYVKFAAEAPMIAAAQNKSIDIASVGSVPFLVGMAQGVDWAMIGINPEGAYTEGVVVGKDSGIATLADLNGKRIGCQQGSTAHYGLIMILRQLGIRIDEVTLIDMRPAEQVSAMARMEIDAAMTWEPWLQKMIHEANAKLLTTEGDMGIYTHVDGYAVQNDWLLKNRETAVRFLRALSMAYDVVQKDPSIVDRVLAEELQIEQLLVKEIFENAPPPRMNLWANPRYRYSLVKGSAFHWRLMYLSSFLHDQKITPVEVKVENALDVSVVAEALHLPLPESLPTVFFTEEAPTDQPADATRRQPLIAADRTQIEVYSWWGTGRESAALQRLIDQFNAAHSKAEVVNVASADMARARETIRRQIPTGNPPDTFQVFMGQDLIDTWVKTGHMEPLDDLYSKHDLERVFPKGLLDMVSHDGHRWAVPLNIHRANVLWYSKEAFRKAGIRKAPETWSEFFAVAEKLKAEGITPLAFCSKESWPVVNLFEAVLLGTLGPEAYSGLWNGHTLWSDPKVTEALETFQRTLTYVNANHASLTWNRAAGLLMDGEAAMYIMNDSISREFVANNFTEYGWSHSPGTDGVFDALSDTFGLPKGTEHPELAREFLSLLSSRKGQESFNRLKGSICARIDCDYSGFTDYQKEAAADWRKDVIVPSLTYRGAAGEKWTAAVFGVVTEFVATGDVAQAQQALIDAAEHGNDRVHVDGSATEGK